MTNEKQQNRKTFIDCYRIGRSLEYMDRYDQEQAWKKLNSAIQRKRHTKKTPASPDLLYVLCRGYGCHCFYFILFVAW